MILTCRCRAVRTEKIEEPPRYGILDTYFPAGPSGAGGLYCALSFLKWNKPPAMSGENVQVRIMIQQK